MVSSNGASGAGSAAAMQTEDDRHYFRNGVPSSASDFRRGSPSDAAASAAPSADVDMGVAAAVAEAVELAGGNCVRLFVAGAVTHVGKTTVCLSILAALRDAGFAASELAYVKPATQCEAPDLLKLWCDAEGVEYVSGEQAPLVFYQGFTRSFLAGEQGTSAQWLDKIAAKLDQMAERRRVLIVDGVGFPAVGSIVGCDNADVALAARAPVLLVCKSGVGAAVDSFSLNSSYFQSRGVPVLGAVFNLGELEGFNSWQKCAENIQLWFSQSRGGRRERYYGVIPVAPSLNGLRERVADTSDTRLRELARLNASHFASHADLAAVLRDAALEPWNRSASGAPAPKRPRLAASAASSGASSASAASATSAAIAASAAFAPKSRSAVAAVATTQGARGGG